MIGFLHVFYILSLITILLYRSFAHMKTQKAHRHHKTRQKRAEQAVFPHSAAESPAKPAVWGCLRVLGDC
jgi:hypothetical protein